uniref:Bm11810 n=1 Tax=Brugia malayi TaxID=6279 RepID=A0A1I9GAA5_BRUMA|nr:Bm11810 [Brugia malayi]
MVLEKELRVLHLDPQAAEKGSFVYIWDIDAQVITKGLSTSGCLQGINGGCSHTRKLAWPEVQLLLFFLGKGRDAHLDPSPPR